jgi:hypothetical protein
MRARDLIDVITDLFKAYRQVPDDFQFTLYARELQGIPLPIVEAAVRLSIRTRPGFPADVAQLLEDIDTVRQAHPDADPDRESFTPCSHCVEGWVEAEPPREIPDRVLLGWKNGKAITGPLHVAARMKRCACWFAWRDRQGLSKVVPRPSVHIDKDKAIGAAAEGAWSSTREIAASSSKVKRFQQRVSGGKA